MWRTCIRNRQADHKTEQEDGYGGRCRKYMDGWYFQQWLFCVRIRFLQTTNRVTSYNILQGIRQTGGGAQTMDLRFWKGQDNREWQNVSLLDEKQILY